MKHIKPIALTLSAILTANLLGTSFSFAPSALAAPAADATVAAKATGKGTVSLKTASQSGSTVTAGKGQLIRVVAQPKSGYYLAQVRISTNGGKSYKALSASSGYTFKAKAGKTLVRADFVSKVWDGTVDVSWFDKSTYEATTTYTLSYPAQLAGLSALVNGLFNDYPTKAKTSKGKTMKYKGKEGNASYLNGKTVQVPAPSKVDTKHLYATYTTKGVRITDSQNNYKLTAARKTTTTVVGDASAIKATKGTGVENSESQNLKTSNDYWKGAYDFTNKTIKINADMDFGAKKTSSGKWSVKSPNYMPIGGQYTMLQDNGYAKLSASFNGILDGGGHDFTNLYCERFANTAYGDSQSVGIVGRLGTHDDDGEDERVKNPSVRNICLESGLISARRSVAGIVGKTGKTSSNNDDGTIGTVIENCINKAIILGTDKKGTAGIVGGAFNGGTVRNCANLGTVTNRMQTPTGGIAGYNENCILNCYNVGTVTADAAGSPKESTYAEGIGTRNGDFNHFVGNCWWLAGSSIGNGGGYHGTTAGSGGKGTGSVTEFGPGTEHGLLQAADLNTKTSKVWVDAEGVNTLKGYSYPALWYQVQDNDPCTLTIQHPEHATITATTLYGEGRGVANDEPVEFGTTLKLGIIPDPGWILTGYTCNGEESEDGIITVSGDTTVAATVHEAAAMNIELPTSEAYTLTVTKTGAIKSGEGYEYVEDYPVRNGDTIYEGDEITVVTEPMAGAKPNDPSYEYTDEFFCYVNGRYAKGGVFTVEADDGPEMKLEVTRRQVKRDWSTVADTSWFDASNPKSEYAISTPQQLAGAAKLVDEGTTTFQGITLKLTCDISLKDSDGAARGWVPLGTTEKTPFQGTLDGCGNAVKLAGSAVSTRVGLVGYLGEGGAVKNLTTTGFIEGDSYVGGIVGYLAGGTISNCVNKASITGASTGSLGTDGTGGIVGYMIGGTVENCLNSGNILGANYEQNGYRSYIGGIVGCIASSTSASSDAMIYACANRASVIGNRYLGGIAGCIYGSFKAVAIQYCCNTGDITGWDTVGGLVGYLRGAGSKNLATVEDCYNAGFVSGTSELTGALVGQGYLGNWSITGCYWIEGRGEIRSGWAGEKVADISALGYAGTGATAATACKDYNELGNAVADKSGAPFIVNQITYSSVYRNDCPLLPCDLADSLPTGCGLASFLSEDGSQVLQQIIALDGTTVRYSGAAPTKEPTASKHYLFSGWTDAAGNPTATITATAAGSSVRAAFIEAAHQPEGGKCLVCGYVEAEPPAVASVTAVSKKKATVTASWKKVESAEGYQVSFTCNGKAKIVTTGVGKASAKVTGLSKGKKCTVKVRAWVTGLDGTKLYGSWSKAVTVKVKK